MSDDILENAIHLQLLVGYLGEQDQHGWWQSSFLSNDADAFLGPIFPRSLPLARYKGALEAAKIVHDERIGVGRVFHLFRLPSELEQSLFDQVRRFGWSEATVAALNSTESAFSALEALTKNSSRLQEGPVKLGDSERLNSSGWVSAAAEAYLSAFRDGSKTFPYWSEAA